MEPWGSWRDNMHTGIVASILSNVYRRKNSRPVSPDDFMLVDPVTHRERETQKTLNWLKSMARKKPDG